ncbi:probable multidrug resistance-associated protein lethal(2)03659 [Tribolium castaneum]|uniref:probable multidrug resistance-associated protein lethal(2)03659 n=1 Tax=Tribolium castaneum TaxID=7070 RepID=UPI0000D56097|nr:PREDICTED: probable multidrug resistance-associated protein lethal(2)03659 [Tribolium castaneum]XP_968748.1 PREDICTED: probable multidrug resistance-associated protein lethal(2)03659 [Tribolium castaneum]|eukprot:XP_015835557.1 PREDICTED: probable multidrug resistance-associated protein lethal(2)03659 [Tribolium castaneum]
MEDKQRSQLNPTKQSIHPKQKASFLSNVFFCWALPLFVKGFKKDLSEEDLYGPLKAHDSKRLGDLLEAAWIKEESTRRNPSFWRAIIKVFGREFGLLGLYVIVIEFFIKMSQPLFLGKLMEYYTPNQETMSKTTAWYYAVGIVAMSFANALLGHSCVFGLMHLGMKVRVASCSLIYRKALRLSKSALVDTTVGQMVNLLSNDVNRFDMSVIHLHNLWVAPFQLAVMVYLLYTTLGLTSLVGVGFLCLFIPLQMYLAKRISVYRLRTALKTDHRVRLMNEIICGIQVIKMYTWEKPFAKLVQVARKLEVQEIKAASYIRAINLSLNIFLNRTAIFLCILTYILTGNTLHSQYVYVVTCYYGVLRQSIVMFLPQAITTLAETNVSVKRIEKFLTAEELQARKQLFNGLETHTKAKNGSIALIQEKPQNVGIQMENVSVKWVTTATDYTLNNITLSVGSHQLVAIVGPVGSGKTTLLHVILKELSLSQGNLEVGGTISYASQEPWLFGGSIKQNILFGQKMDMKRYKEVVRVCALERDFSLFPYGDRTIVGERGAMLSGGQKARINLARAIYKEADIYLLDDPLSAVDTHVGKQLFEDCITGYLNSKCVVLVTHQLQYLRTVNKIYLLDNGKVAASGTHSELKNSDEEFLKLLEGETEEEIDDENKASVKKAKSVKSLEKLEMPTEVKEQRGSGNVSGKIYKSYMKAGGSIFSSFICISLFVLAQLGASGTDYFLSFWVNLEQDRLKNNETILTSAEINDTYYKEEFRELFFTSENCMYIYTALIIFIIVMTLTRSLNFFRFCMKASRNLHDWMFSRVVHTFMRFFNTNSSGRILNRFSKDMGSIDEILPQTVVDTLQIGLIALFVNIVIATVNTWILIPSVIIFGLFYAFRIVFLATSRDLKRMEGTTRSPVFTHMTASLQGLTTIRAFGAQEILRAEFDQHQDLHSSAFYLFLGCNRTFGFWLDIHCVIYIGLVTLSFLFVGTETYGGNVGLGITQAITLTGMFQWGMRQWSELENQMTSVERVVEYTEVAVEVDDASKKPPQGWPTMGVIEFRSVSMRYAPEEPLVLKKLNFRVNSGEKVGIVGRTGAGKSSLISALFRLADIDGAILIDDIDTKQISLECLRSKISIIPQEPVLFSGTLRKNLDPFDEFNDEELWDALEEVELKNAISDLPAGLHSNVSEGGTNFSVGQRQLLCLARAVVRSNKILVLDEATANVDPQTDELIQSTIRRKFKDCTVLTIAHRLHTVMDSDKILVMEAGQAAEFDHPHALLQNNESIFYGLVQQTGKGMAENLTKIAEEAHARIPKM